MEIRWVERGCDEEMRRKVMVLTKVIVRREITKGVVADSHFASGETRRSQSSRLAKHRLTRPSFAAYVIW